ncbi:hypothetical protein RvY_00281 [Ramazzottius varieornatus]|uniref:Cytochrome P450 n=1 Tax=Ramazzottius varieornatus TaxID=947166 RepID=A0A1D1UGD6_RAMVA|nr:hypothetical protein RvY_00281 [Ramazzottius varieornatus]
MDAKSYLDQKSHHTLHDLSKVSAVEQILNKMAPFTYPVVAAFVLFLCGVAAWLVYYRWKNRSFPPGPIGLPFLGYLPFLGGYLPEKFARLSATHGDVMTVQLGKKQAVVLGSLDALRAAFVDQATVFSGRGDVFLLRELWDGNGGILMSEGAKWNSLRSFTIANLKLNDAMDAIKAETMEVISVLKTHLAAGDMPQDSRSFLMQVVANVGCHWTLGQRVPYVDQTFQAYLANFRKVADLMHHCSSSALVPSLNPVSSKTPQMAKLEKEFQDKIDYIRTLMLASLKHNKPNFAGDFLAKSKDKTDRESSLYTERELVMVLNDLWGASTEAGTSLLQWAVFYMIKYPTIQRTVQEELDRVIGAPKGGIIVDADKVQLPYTMATLQEIERCASVSPFGVLRCNTEATDLRGYTIPPRTLIIPNLWQIHHDKANWEDPTTFQPERFLDAKRNVTRPPYLVPFSIGTRACPFQNVAESMLFSFFANLLHCFTLDTPAGQTLLTESDRISALTDRPKDFQFVVKARYEQLLPGSN